MATINGQDLKELPRWKRLNIVASLLYDLAEDYSPVYPTEVSDEVNGCATKLQGLAVKIKLQDARRL